MLKTALGFVLLCLGLFLSFGDLFLARWAWAAHGRLDIIARGSFLLGMLSPYFAVAVALVSVGVAILVAARRNRRPFRLALVAILAVALTYAALYLDTTASVWRVLGTLRLALGAPAYTVFDVLLLVAGAWMVASRQRGETVATAV
jgi:hypothetical protein